MKLLSTLFAALLLATAAPAAGQTVKALAYNTTNGQVVAVTNVTFTNAVFFGQDFSIDSNGQFAYGGNVWFEAETQTWFQPFNFEYAADAATTRTNLGLVLPALTNTSNVTMMRALAGSTNTAEPFSGAIQYLDHSSNTWQMIVSNGIILDNYEQ